MPLFPYPKPCVVIQSPIVPCCLTAPLPRACPGVRGSVRPLRDTGRDSLPCGQHLRPRIMRLQPVQLLCAAARLSDCRDRDLHRSAGPTVRAARCFLLAAALVASCCCSLPRCWLLLLLPAASVASCCCFQPPWLLLAAALVASMRNPVPPAQSSRHAGLLRNQTEVEGTNALLRPGAVYPLPPASRL